MNVFEPGYTDVIIRVMRVMTRHDAKIISLRTPLKIVSAWLMYYYYYRGRLSVCLSTYYTVFSLFLLF